MTGNVWEWVQDKKGAYPSYAQTNPIGSSSGGVRVYRGGSWLYEARRCRVSFRNSDPPELRDGNLGFRLALQ